MAMHTEYGEDNRYNRRRIITLFTDAPAHPLEDYDDLMLIADEQECGSLVSYLKQIPHSLSDLYDTWEDMQRSGTELALVAPSGEYP